ncbi:G-protein coupled receptor 35 isoform X1 [Manis javanica]|uniref:G-protein coupled receptor 35 isoform X1 n=1 Tax=Manis javanica TaxID=9974 RepID=UPI003C6D320C
MNSSNCSSSELAWPRAVTYVLYTYTSLLLVLGLALNGVALWVLCHRLQQWTETRVYMANLAVSDLCLLCTLPFFLHSLRSTVDTPLCQLSQGIYLANRWLGRAREVASEHRNLWRAKTPLSRRCQGNPQGGSPLPHPHLCPPEGPHASPPPPLPGPAAPPAFRRQDPCPSHLPLLPRKPFQSKGRAAIRIRGSMDLGDPPITKTGDRLPTSLPTQLLPSTEAAPVRFLPSQAHTNERTITRSQVPGLPPLVRPCSWRGLAVGQLMLLRVSEFCLFLLLNEFYFMDKYLKCPGSLQGQRLDLIRHCSPSGGECGAVTLSAGPKLGGVSQSWCLKI